MSRCIDQAESSPRVVSSLGQSRWTANQAAKSLSVACLWLLLSTGVRAGEPVATVRVAFDHDGVTATQVHGLADKAAGRKVTADDPVRIASISGTIGTRSISAAPASACSSGFERARLQTAGCRLPIELASGGLAIDDWD